jgi:hypothetical protein
MHKYKLSPTDIKDLITGLGGCLASLRITVDGAKVCFMYREEADNEFDSGWRFMAGDEDDEFLDNPDNFEVYDVNTIANYDQDIIPFLKSPAGFAFEREDASAPFQQIEVDEA